jgi:hypothetical protein
MHLHHACGGPQNDVLCDLGEMLFHQLEEIPVHFSYTLRILGTYPSKKISEINRFKYIPILKMT